MFTVLVSSLFAVAVNHGMPLRVHPVGPVLDVVRLAEVDLAGGFTIVRTVQEYVTRVADIETERDGKTVVTHGPVTGAQDREIVERYGNIKYWRLTDKAGKDHDWTQAKGKTVLFHRSNELPDKAVLKLLAKDALILYGRN